jgi:hypothetical protein
LWLYRVNWGKTFGGDKMSKKRKSIKFELPPIDILKESAEQRKARVQNSKPMGTRVEKDKRKYNRKQKHKREWKDYE